MEGWGEAAEARPIRPSPLTVHPWGARLVILLLATAFIVASFAAYFIGYGYYWTSRGLSSRYSYVVEGLRLTILAGLLGLAGWGARLRQLWGYVLALPASLATTIYILLGPTPLSGGALQWQISIMVLCVADLACWTRALYLFRKRAANAPTSQ